MATFAGKISLPAKNLKPWYAVLLLIGFASAVVLRLAVGGPHVAQSSVAGLVFAACLGILTVARGVSLRLDKKSLLIGLAGTAVLCIPVALAHRSPELVPPITGYLPWAAVVGIVAIAEEAFLRGVLFDAVQRTCNTSLAVTVAAAAFAALHVPLYGWHVVPLDLVVGVWLGVLRLAAQSWWAPGIAHSLTDLMSWWLR